MKRIHLEELNQKCCYCCEKRSSNGAILRHIRIVHFDIRQFPCPICNYRFTCKRDVGTHINSAHKNGQKIETIQSSNDINNFQPVAEMNPTKKLKTPVSCEICKKKFGYLKNKTSHLKRGGCLVKPVKSINYVNKNVQFAPVVETPDHAPAKPVATNDEIPVHERTKKYSCEICQKKFGFRSNMQRHQKGGRCLEKINAVNKNVQFEKVSNVRFAMLYLLMKLV